jgi:hypothetical protein
MQLAAAAMRALAAWSRGVLRPRQWCVRAHCPPARSLGWSQDALRPPQSGDSLQQCGLRPDTHPSSRMHPLDGALQSPQACHASARLARERYPPVTAPWLTAADTGGRPGSRCGGGASGGSSSRSIGPSFGPRRAAPTAGTNAPRSRRRPGGAATVAASRRSPQRPEPGRARSKLGPASEGAAAAAAGARHAERGGGAQRLGASLSAGDGAESEGEGLSEHCCFAAEGAARGAADGAEQAAPLAPVPPAAAAAAPAPGRPRRATAPELRVPQTSSLGSCTAATHNAGSALGPHPLTPGGGAGGALWRGCVLSSGPAAAPSPRAGLGRDQSGGGVAAAAPCAPGPPHATQLDQQRRPQSSGGDVVLPGSWVAAADDQALFRITSRRPRAAAAVADELPSGSGPRLACGHQVDAPELQGRPGSTGGSCVLVSACGEGQAGRWARPESSCGPGTLNGGVPGSGLQAGVAIVSSAVRAQALLVRRSQQQLPPGPRTAATRGPAAPGHTPAPASAPPPGSAQQDGPEWEPAAARAAMPGYPGPPARLRVDPLTHGTASPPAAPLSTLVPPLPPLPPPPALQRGCGTGRGPPSLNRSCSSRRPPDACGGGAVAPPTPMAQLAAAAGLAAAPGGQGACLAGVDDLLERLLSSQAAASRLLGPSGQRYTDRRATAPERGGGGGGGAARGAPEAGGALGCGGEATGKGLRPLAEEQGGPPKCGRSGGQPAGPALQQRRGTQQRPPACVPPGAAPTAARAATKQPLSRPAILLAGRQVAVAAAAWQG